MEKVLKLYTYLDGVNDSPFPNVEYQAVVSDFRYDVKRMGGAPIITCTVMHTLCLDKLWSENVYAYFNGERFFIKQIPTSSYNNTDSRYKHELELVSERIVLDNVYFYDVVYSSENNDKPVSNSSKFSFFGDINEFASRLNQSLQYSNVDYSVVVDDGISSEAKMVSFQDQFFSGAIQEGYNTYNVPFYFEGKVIHFGYTNNAITRTFKYGVDESLLSIQKQNANYKVVNRVTGVGSADNIPYYYPNDSEKGESKALYNGSSDNVQIVDTNKYDKLYLSDTFKYEYISPVTSVPFGKHDYRSIDYKKLDFNQKQIVLTYFITIYEDQVLKFFQKLNGADSKSDAHIYGVDNEFEDYILGSYEKTLKTGQYKIVIEDVATIYLDDSMGDEWVTYVLDNYFELEVSLTTLGYNGWYLNGKPVYLKDYGLSALVSPQVGDVITFEQTSYIAPQKHLMPPIYRESLGKERFYNALNNEYQDGNGGYYEFDNPYVDGKPKEQIVSFEHIKPSIVGATNANGLRIDMFSEFAFDEDDNDEFDEEGNYLHPYFFGKLRKFDGEYGFNLFDHAIDEDEMVISMTSGSCGSCEFVIGVNDDQKNTVQVDDGGYLIRDNDGNVQFGNPQDKQNDTRNNEVWIALRKDINTFGVIMPNASKNYRPSTNDTFVILHIDLPKAYILAAEDKLKEELIKYMSLNNSEKFNFSISFSRIFFAENPKILEQLNENARIQIEYDNTTYELYISSYSYSMSKDAPLPEIRIELSDTLTISQNALQTAIGDVKNEILSSIGVSANIDILKQGLRYFLRKDKDDKTTHNLGVGKSLSVGDNLEVKGSTSIQEELSIGGNIESKDFAEGTKKGGYAIRKNSEEQYEVESDNIIARILAKTYDLLVQNNATFIGDLSSEEFISGFIGGKGWSIRTKEILNAEGVNEKKSVAEFDDLIVRGSMRIYEFIVSQLLGENDNRIFTGMMEVDHYDANDGKVYLKTDNGRLYNPFRVDDVIIVQQYGGNHSQESGYYVTKQYEFIVTEVGVGEQGEDRLDWVRFRNFTTSMEGGNEELITEYDTLVRIDNISDANRKGIIQLMSVGEDTPYMDFIYGAKTDPENSLKGRLGNLGGVYNPLFGWLKDFGAYLNNLYAVGEFVIAHTGENVSDSIEIAKGQFRTNYRQTTFDMSEEQNFFTNASMTNNCEHWVLGSEATEYFMVDELPQFFNFDLYASEQTYAGLSEWKGRDMLRLSKSSIMQSNSLIDKAGTHKVYTGSVENADGSYTDTYKEVADTLYLSVRFFVSVSGKLEFGFVENGNFIDNSFHYSSNVTAREDGYEVKLSGIWDGKGDFTITSTGDVYVDLLSLTDKPLDNFKITTETKIEQNATRISLLGKKINGVEGSVTDLGIELNAAKEEIRLYVDKEVGGVSKDLSELSVSVGNITAKVEKINLDANGNVTNISKSGLVLESNFASLFTTQVTSQGVAKTAEIKTYVDDSISKIKISADQIDMSANDYISIINKGTTTISASRVDLKGKVTFSMLDSDTQDTIDSKVTQSDVDSSINTFKGTIIEGGKIKTELLEVTEIYATKGTVGGFSIGEKSLTNTAGDVQLSIGNLKGTKFAVMNSPNNSMLQVRNDDATAIYVYTHGTLGVGIYITAQTGSKAINSYGNVSLTARSGELISITGLALSATATSGTSTSNMDFIRMTGNLTLPEPNSMKGKVYFIKCNDSYTLSVPQCVRCTSAYSSSPGTATWSNDDTRAFISDGVVWHEFYTGT